MISIKALREHLSTKTNLKGLDIDLLRAEDKSVLILGKGVKKKITTEKQGKVFLTKLDNQIFYARVNLIALKGF